MKRFNYPSLENKIKSRDHELQSLEKAKEMEKNCGYTTHRVNSKTIVLSRLRKEADCVS